MQLIDDDCGGGGGGSRCTWDGSPELKFRYPLTTTVQFLLVREHSLQNSTVISGGGGHGRETERERGRFFVWFWIHSTSTALGSRLALQ